MRLKAFIEALGLDTIDSTLIVERYLKVELRSPKQSEAADRYPWAHDDVRWCAVAER